MPLRQAEAPDDAADQLLLFFPIDAGHAQADRSHGFGGVEILDHLMKYLLDRELAMHDEVGPGAYGLGHHLARLVGQETYRLGASGVDSDYVAHVSPTLSGSEALPSSVASGYLRMASRVSEQRCRARD